ncbi:SAC3 domain-containing protein 1 isoform X1 [Amblyraja radiata]|uniref:SAC3 domain-containing protein 1 isoform X1 n=1 Tax=Amblyraja radiata TaxID=386614 RepID=UPI001402BBF9|nr:SAC3 domain-containing protein 1 isoform X1 [Amblyraja radiata]
MRAARCPGMCPERERCERQGQARLHRLEVATGAAVKEWRRPAAGSEAAAPDQLRPPDVLLRTVRHLVARVVPRAEPRAGVGAEPGDEVGAWAGVGAEPGDEVGAAPGDEVGAWAGVGAEPRAGVGAEPGDEVGAWTGAEPRAGVGAEPGDEVGTWAGVRDEPGDEVGAWVKAAAEPGAGVLPEPWPLVHDFVMDRLRSVRQDMVSQRLGGRPAATILEHSLRFLLCGQLWLGRPPPSPRPRHSQPGSVEAQVRECFSRLLAAYSQGRDVYENQAEFQALALLYDLDSDQALHHALQLPSHIKDSPEMRTALGINRALTEGNYVRCLRAVRSLPFVESCAVYRHIASLQHRLLRAFSHGYSCCNCRYPLQALAEILAVDTGDTAADLCRRHGQQVNGDSVCFQKSSYVEPDPDIQPAPELLELVTIKQRGRTRSSIIQGCKMPSINR